MHNARVQDYEVFRQKLKHINARWYALFLMIFTIFGSYYCYDNPSELEERIQEKFGISQTQYSLLYSSYSLPNMIIPVCGGMIIGKIGRAWGLIMFSVIITLGQTICALGGWFGCFTLLVVGRGIHGLGSECQQMVQAVYVASWFKDQEISFAMGVSQVTLVVSFLGGWIVPIVARDYGIGWAFLTGTMACMLSLIMSFALICLDSKAQKHDQELIEERRK